MAYQSPLLDRPGAIQPPADHLEIGVPWHWGDPFAEQRTAVRGVAVVDRSHRRVITVTGQERLSWLHLVLSQHVSELPDRTGTESLVLDSQGRIDAHQVLTYLDDVVYLDTDPESRATSAMPGADNQDLLEYLEAMKFWSPVEINEVTEEFAMLTLLGPDIPKVLDVDLATEMFSVAPLPGGGWARRMPWPGASAIDLLVPREKLTNWWDQLTEAGARPAGTWAYDALRIESLRPRIGLDTDERAIPHEVNWVHSAAHVAKGCYRGQETIAKVHNVGQPPRHMMLLHLDGSPEVYPEPGDPVARGDRTVGHVGSVTQHHELGPVALALVRRNTSPDAELLVGAEDRVVQAAIDPDSVPEAKAAPGRDAARSLRG